MAIRLGVEGDDRLVDLFIRSIQMDKRWKFYSPHENLTSPTEKRVEYYVNESPSRIKEVEKKRLTPVTIKTPKDHGGKTIILDLLDVKLFPLCNGTTAIFGMSYDPYSNPNTEE